MRKCRITNFFIVQEQDDYPLQFKVWLGKIATEYRDAWTTKKAEMAARIMGGGEAVGGEEGASAVGWKLMVIAVPGNLPNENVVTCPKAFKGLIAPTSSFKATFSSRSNWQAWYRSANKREETSKQWW